MLSHMFQDFKIVNSWNGFAEQFYSWTPPYPLYHIDYLYAQNCDCSYHIVCVDEGTWWIKWATSYFFLFAEHCKSGFAFPCNADDNIPLLQVPGRHHCTQRCTCHGWGIGLNSTGKLILFCREVEANQGESLFGRCSADASAFLRVRISLSDGFFGLLPVRVEKCVSDNLILGRKTKQHSLLSYPIYYAHNVLL